MPSSSTHLPLVTPQPYVPIAVEELANVTDVRHWTNLNVRAAGRVRIRDLSSSRVALKEILEPQPHDRRQQPEVWVNYSLVQDEAADKLQEGRQVQILGELFVHRGRQLIYAHIVLSYEGVTPALYRRYLEAIQPRCPINVGRRAEPEQETGEQVVASFETSLSCELFADTSTVSTPHSLPAESPKQDSVPAAANDSSADLFDDSNV